MTNMPLEGASWSLRFSKHNNLQLEICCKIMRVLPLIITHDFHGHVQEDHGGVVVQGRVRDRPRFFDQVGHQTTNASIGNKYFFTK